MVFHRHPAVGRLDFVVRRGRSDLQDGVGGVILLIIHGDHRGGIRCRDLDYGGNGLDNALLGRIEVAVGHGDLDQVLEQLKTLGVVHVGRNLAADLVDVDLLSV